MKITEFHEYAKEADLDEDFYPYSDVGPRSIQRLQKYFWRIFNGLIVFLIFKSIAKLGEWQAPNIGQIGTKVRYLYDGFVRNFEWLARFAIIFVWIMVAIWVISFVVYMVNVTKRQRCFEREVIASDWEANSLRKGILRSMNAKPVYKELKRKMNKEAENSADASVNTQSEVEALKSLLRLKVFVNVRQSLESDEIEKSYRIVSEVPYIQSEQEILFKRLENVEQIATRLKKGKVSFGSQSLSADQSIVVYKDRIIVEDRYAAPEIDEGPKEKIEYEMSFPMDLLEDRSDKIAELKEKAMGWSKRTSHALDGIMATQKISAKRISNDVGNANALFTYEMSFSLDSKKFDQLGEQLDNVFRTSGCSVGVKEGNILVTMPLPKSLSIPINVPTMYRDAFY